MISKCSIREHCGCLFQVGLENEEEVEKTGRKFRDTVLALGGGRAPDLVFKVIFNLVYSILCIDFCLHPLTYSSWTDFVWPLVREACHLHMFYGVLRTFFIVSQHMGPLGSKIRHWYMNTMFSCAKVYPLLCRTSGDGSHPARRCCGTTTSLWPRLHDFVRHRA